MINSAQPELLALAEAVRGQEWADRLAAALVAANGAGWDGIRAQQFASRLIYAPDAWPRDLIEAARWPAGGRPASPGVAAARLAEMRSALPGGES
jgi:hypothetical protein